MRAVVLVGGFGTRLRPLTLHTPKQMLPVVDRPMIEWVVDHLGRAGVDEVVLALGYKPDAFQAAYPDGRCAGVRLHYAVEPEPLDTAGAVRFAASEAGIAERFLVLNGDVLSDLDLGAFGVFHDAAGAEATIALHRVDDPSRYGVVPTSDDGRVLAFVEKPPPGEAPTDLINAGTYVFEPSVLDRIASGRRVSVERETFPAIVADEALYAFDDGGAYWLDTGTPADYLRASLDVLDGRRGASRSPIAATASVDPTASVARAVIGEGVTVGPGATVTDSVVLAGATIGAGATVRASIVGQRASIGDDATVDDGTVLGDDVVVETGSSLRGIRVPEPVDG